MPKNFLAKPGTTPKCKMQPRNSIATENFLVGMPLPMRQTHPNGGINLLNCFFCHAHGSLVALMERGRDQTYAGTPTSPISPARDAYGGCPTVLTFFEDNVGFA